MQSSIGRAINREGIFHIGLCPCIKCGCKLRDAEHLQACARCGADVEKQSMGQRAAFAFACLLSAARHEWPVSGWIRQVLDSVASKTGGDQ